MAPLWFHLTHYNSGWHNGNYDTQASPIVGLDFLSTQPPPSVIYLPVFGSLPSSWVVDRKLLMHSCFCSTFPILTLQCKNWTWMFLSLKFNLPPQVSSSNQSRQLHISHTWNDADKYKRYVCCRWWYRQVVYGCAWGWEAIGEGLGDNLVGVYYFIRFSTCWDYLGLLFICMLSTCRSCVFGMYLALLKRTFPYQ